MQLVVVDAGRYATKVRNAKGRFSFLSKVSKAHNRHRENLPNDIQIRYQGKDFFIGQLAEREGFSATLMTQSKVHEHTLLEVLVSCFLAEVPSGEEILLVTAVPIELYDSERERSGIRRLLEGKHEVLVNGVYRVINIAKVVISLECAVAYQTSREMGTIRLVDPGARTTNYATYKDGIYIGRESGTILHGWDTIRDADPDLMADIIVGEVAKTWNTSDVVKVIGGKAEDLVEPLKLRGFYRTMAPTDAQFATVDGLWEIGRRLMSNARGL